MDEFERKKKLIVKAKFKYFKKIMGKKFLTDTLIHEIFLHILLFQNILSLFIYFEKKFYSRAKNAIFFDVLPKSSRKGKKLTILYFFI